MAAAIALFELAAAAAAFIAAWYWRKSAASTRAPQAVELKPGDSVIDKWFGHAARWNYRAASYSSVAALLGGIAALLSFAYLL